MTQPAAPQPAAQPCEPQPRGWLTHNVRVLSAVSFLQDLASELLYPLLPIYLTAVLGAPPAVVGAIEGAAEGGAAMTKLVAGPLGDRFARRPLIAAGYGMAALGKLIVAVAGAWPGVLAGRVVDRLGKGIRGAPRDALLVDGLDPSVRGRVFGFHRTMDTLGAVLGPLIGLAGYELLDHHIPPLLYIAVIPGVLSVLLIGLVSESRVSQRRVSQRRVSQCRVSGASGTGPPPERRHVFRGLREMPRRYWRAVVVLVGFGLVNVPDALLLLRLNEIGFSVAEVILAYVTYNLVYALGSFPAGVLADRLSRPAIFGVGLVFFAVGYIGLGLTASPVLAWVFIGVCGLFTACTDGVGKSWISALAPAERQSSAQGVFQGFSGLAMLVAGIWAGLFWGADGSVPLVIAGAFGGCFAVVLLVPRWSRCE